LQGSLRHRPLAVMAITTEIFGFGGHLTGNKYNHRPTPIAR